MGVFGSRQLKERFFDPAVEREVRREKAVMKTEKQASIDELSSTIAHEIRNPIAAAKSLVQQMGEDPHVGRERRVRARSRSRSSTASSGASRTSSGTPRRRTTRSRT